MKKLLFWLLVAALGVELTVVVIFVGGCVSPRQALYTVTDAMMNAAYRFRCGWLSRATVI